MIARTRQNTTHVKNPICKGVLERSVLDSQSFQPEEAELHIELANPKHPSQGL